MSEAPGGRAIAQIDPPHQDFGCLPAPRGRPCRTTPDHLRRRATTAPAAEPCSWSRTCVRADLHRPRGCLAAHPRPTVGSFQPDPEDERLDAHAGPRRDPGQEAPGCLWISVPESVHELLPTGTAAARNSTHRASDAAGRRPCRRRRADYGSDAQHSTRGLCRRGVSVYPARCHRWCDRPSSVITDRRPSPPPRSMSAITPATTIVAAVGGLDGPHGARGRGSSVATH